MIRWLFLITLSLPVASCSPAYADSATMPLIDYENVTASLREAPVESHMCLDKNIFFEARGESIESWPRQTLMLN